MINFLILALATWRIMSLLHIEDGPYLIFERLRTRIGIYFDEAKRERLANNELAKAFNCPACLSVWVGLGIALAYWILPGVTLAVCLPLALSTGAILVEGVIPDG